jgi:hypothetical protein
VLIEEVIASPVVARRYLERYVNDGSPSGFTQKYTSSPATSPFGPTPTFPLLAAGLPDHVIEDFGCLPGWLSSGEVPLHPDMALEPLIVFNALEVNATTIQVTPTASTRTVEVLDPAHPGFVKLSYKGLLGRVERQISKSHALSALDVTDLLDQAIERRSLPAVCSFLRESGARVASLKTTTGANYEWGTVFRESEPHPSHAATKFFLPVFALFGRDKKRPDDPLILNQLIGSQSPSAHEYVFHEIISPIVTCYFELMLGCAMQFECNAQNVLLGFDSSGRTTAVVFRDFESVDKDLSLAEDLGLQITFRSAPFKCVHRGLYNYSIKHSFMYDFKLGEYVLSPIIGAASSGATSRCLIEHTKELGRGYVGRLPCSFFPADGQWYSYDNVVVDKTARRPYVGRPSPKYR